VRAGNWPRTWRIAAVALTSATAACAALLPAAPVSAAPKYVPITGAGSTWSGTAFQDWTAGVTQFGMKVTYLGGGSSVGRQDFADATTTFGASDIPYGVNDGTTTDPAPARGYAYMPDTAGGTVFMYNLKIGTRRVTNLRLSGAAIAGIFTAKITSWNNPIIKADNPGLNMPNKPIIPVVRSDGSGATALLTQWMLATEKSYWTNYCKANQISVCTQTSNYPKLPGSRMVAQNGDLGVAGYVSQQQSDGAIGYVQDSYAIATGFPVVLLLNKAGYYTEPTAGHVAVSLLKAKVKGCNQTTGVCSNPTNDPLYLTQDLSGVYNDLDKRTYELSGYSYMILPTDLSVQGKFTSAQGYTLGAFGAYLLCNGQAPLDQLGYSSLPINLVLAGFTQLQRIPGNAVPTTGVAQIQSCRNPTFDASDTLGHNKLAETDPFPPACDKRGPTQCVAGTGGAAKTSTPVNPSAAGGQPGGSNGSNGSAGPGSSSSSGAGGGGSVPQNCSPDSGNCNQANASGGNAAVNANPTAAASSLGDGLKVTLMALASALLLCLVVLPPVITQAGRRRRRRSGPGGMPGVLP
jgi:ABC-type phosphate transport system substrate-binding protein